MFLTWIAYMKKSHVIIGTNISKKSTSSSQQQKETSSSKPEKRTSSSQSNKN
jgi:hypothetical protein